MEDNKYYTPCLEEFCVRFEYELEDLHDDLINKTWRSCQVERHDCLGDIRNWLDLGEIRVKYLDKSDIEELGFQQSKTNDYYLPIDKDGVIAKYRFTYDVSSHKCIIILKNFYTVKNELKQTDTNITDNEVLFNGIIKNKSELKKILTMLKIV